MCVILRNGGWLDAAEEHTSDALCMIEANHVIEGSLEIGRLVKDDEQMLRFLEEVSCVCNEPGVESINLTRRTVYESFNL